MATKALVTGAAGFVGANLIRQLLAAGESVRALVRFNTANLSNLDDLKQDIEIVFGDIRDERSLRRAMDGCNRVYHCAALYSLHGPADEFVQHNVLGTRAVCRACVEHGIERLVFTSSVVAVGFSTGTAPADEDTVWNLARFGVPYHLTKHLAEVEVLRAVGRGLDAVIVNPSSPLGKFDRKPTPTGKLVLDLMRGRMRVTADVGLPFVDVRDVALGHQLAMEKGVKGERYILSAGSMSLNAMALDIHQRTGAVLPWLRLNKPALKVLTSLRWGLPGVAYPWLQTASALLGRMEYDNRKSVEKLGLTYRPISAALSEQIEFYYAAGMATRSATVATSSSSTGTSSSAASTEPRAADPTVAKSHSTP